MAKIKLARQKIEEALRSATFANAVFGGIGADDLDKTIKKETRLFRETWVIPRLMESLRAIDPCKPCDSKGKVWDGVAMSAYRVDCPSCKGSGISGGLPFDPYKLTRESAGK